MYVGLDADHIAYTTLQSVFNLNVFELPSVIRATTMGYVPHALHPAVKITSCAAPPKALRMSPVQPAAFIVAALLSLPVPSQPPCYHALGIASSRCSRCSSVVSSAPDGTTCTSRPVAYACRFHARGNGRCGWRSPATCCGDARVVGSCAGRAGNGTCTYLRDNYATPYDCAENCAAQASDTSCALVTVLFSCGVVEKAQEVPRPSVIV